MSTTLTSAETATIYNALADAATELEHLAKSERENTNAGARNSAAEDFETRAATTRALAARIIDAHRITLEEQTNN